MGTYSAIGDTQRPAVRHHHDFMRADTVGGKFRNPSEAVGGIIDADDAVAGLKRILGRVEQTAIGGKHAMAIEVPVGGGVKQHRFGRHPPVHRDGEVAGAPGKRDKPLHLRIGGKTMATAGKRMGGN
jgi:hypothetical protein